MSKEIKFRAYDTKIKHMFTWFFLELLEEHVPRAKGLIWMQYTGLHDKNGKEIYEGDIVKNQEAIRLSKLGMINPTLEKYGVKPPEWLTIIRDIRQLPFYEGQSCDAVEIVGNIYENPELL